MNIFTFPASKQHVVKRFPSLTPFFVATVAASASVPGAYIEAENYAVESYHTSFDILIFIIFLIIIFIFIFIYFIFIYFILLYFIFILNFSIIFTLSHSPRDAHSTCCGSFCIILNVRNRTYARYELCAVVRTSGRRRGKWDLGL